MATMLRKTRLRPSLIDSLAIAAIAVAPFLPALFRGLIPFFMDTLAQFYPIRHYAAQLLHQGQLPLWNRTMFCGVPLLANPQWGLLYPLNWPFLAIPGPFWFTISYPLHFAIGAIGAYALVRAWTGSRIGAWAAAIAMLFNTMTLSRVAFGAHHLALAWVPWAWLVISRFAIKESAWRGMFRPVAALSGLIALQLLAGAPQVVFYALISYGLLALGTGWRRKIPAVIMAAILAGMLSAPQLLPTWEFVQACDRGQGLQIEQVRQGTLEARDWLRTFWGGTALPEETESTAAVGAIGMAFVLLALMLNFRKALPMASVVVAFMFYAHPLLSPLLFRYSPMYASFHDPKRVVTIAAIAASALVGLGVAGMFEQDGRKRGLRIALCLIAFMLSVAVHLLLDLPLDPIVPEPAFGWLKLPPQTRVMLLIATTATALVFVVLHQFSRIRRPVLIAIAVMAFAVDIATFSISSLDLKMAPVRGFFDSARGKNFPREGRFFAFDTFDRNTSGRGIYSYDYPAMRSRLFPNAAAYYGLEDAQGYDAFKLEPYALTLRAMHSRAVLLYESHFGLITVPQAPMVARLAVHHATGPVDHTFAIPGQTSVRTPQTAAPFDREFMAGGERWLRYRRREDLVSMWPRAIVSDPFAPEADLPDRSQLILNSGQQLPPMQWPKGAGEGQVKDVVIRANRISAEVVAPEGGAFLLLRDSYADGWTAHVDENNAPVLLAEGMFRAVPIPEGAHQVLMKYWPPGLTMGLVLCFAGAALLGIWAGLETVRKRKT